MAVSVITAAGREEEYLFELGRSIDQLASYLGEEITWIIASDGPSVEWIEELLMGVETRKIILGTPAWGEKLGPAKTRNRALRLVNTEYIINLDSDDYCEPKAMATLIKETIAHEQVFGAGLIIDVTYEGDILWNGPPAPYPTGLIGKDSFLKYAAENGYLPWHCSATVAKTEALKEVGGWEEREDLRAHEDTLLWARISRKHTGFFLSETVMFYRKHKNSLTKEITWPKNSNILHYLAEV